MKKIYILLCALMASTAAMSQSAPEYIENLDVLEDTVQVTTIADIIELQEMVTNSNSTAAHNSKVWGYNKYFMFSYGGMSLNPKKTISLGYDGFNGGNAPDFKSNWSLALTLGRNYGLHKKPIANMVKFNIDFTYFDLGIAHYSAEGDKNTPLYDSSASWEEKNEDTDKVSKMSYIPWCLGKYKADFGMAVGPSITLAPFTSIKSNRGVHFLKLNMYYHIGYHVSLLWMKDDDKHDANPDKASSSSSSSSNYYSTSKNSSDLKMNFGHGLTNTFGIMLSWKSIGLGWEIKSTNVSYQSLSQSIYGHEHYKFETKSNRIYLVIRY